MFRTIKSISLLLVDARTLFREALAQTLEEQEGLVVVGQAGSFKVAIPLAVRVCPNIVIVDAELPEEGVFRSVQRLAQACPQSRIIVLTMNDDQHSIQTFLSCDISGYFSKDTTLDELVSAIHSINANHDRAVVSLPLDNLIDKDQDKPTPLSRRECEVLGLVSQGLSNAQVASRLHITEATVKRHLQNVFSKIGARSRIDAVNRATAMALIPPPMNGNRTYSYPDYRAM
jgi:DNA-binding NarL/FixJ family response regulator